MTPIQLFRPPLTCPPPPNHPILILSNAFKIAIRKNRIYALKSLSKQFIHQLDTNLEFFAYDHSDLATWYQTAEDIINAHTTLTADPPLPSSTSNLVLVSNFLSLIHRPGAANLGTLPLVVDHPERVQLDPS